MVPLNIWPGTKWKVSSCATPLKNTVTLFASLPLLTFFPGDMLFKNFGVTRHGRVVFMITMKFAT